MFLFILWNNFIWFDWVHFILSTKMRRVAKSYEVSFVVNTSEFGDDDPLTQNVSSHMNSRKFSPNDLEEPLGKYFDCNPLNLWSFWFTRSNRYPCIYTLIFDSVLLVLKASHNLIYIFCRQPYSSILWKFHGILQKVACWYVSKILRLIYITNIYFSHWFMFL